MLCLWVSKEQRKAKARLQMQKEDELQALHFP